MSREHASGYMSRPCEGHAWDGLFVAPPSEGPTQEVTTDMKCTDTLGAI